LLPIVASIEEDVGVAEASGEEEAVDSVEEVLHATGATRASKCNRSMATALVAVKEVEVFAAADLTADFLDAPRETDMNRAERDRRAKMSIVNKGSEIRDMISENNVEEEAVPKGSIDASSAAAHVVRDRTLRAVSPVLMERRPETKGRVTSLETRAQREAMKVNASRDGALAAAAAVSAGGVATPDADDLASHRAIPASLRLRLLGREATNSRPNRKILRQRSLRPTSLTSKQRIR